MKKEIIIIAGPTAVGKTKYAIEVARALNGEIVSADSMQLYKYMDIGSAKPTTEELSLAKHHLIDEIDPRQPFSAREYQKRAKAAIAEIFQKGKQPVISGGTGLYINSLIYDMDFSAPPNNSGYREQLEKLAVENGKKFIHDLLREKDPFAADRIHVNNLRKVIRALEAVEMSGKGIKPFEASFVLTKDYDYTLIGLSRDRTQLYERIDKRVDTLIEEGLLDEVKSLLNMGLLENNISMKGIGYKEIIRYFQGNYDLNEAIRLVKQNTRHYAKRQLTWFRRYEDMKWFDLTSFESDQAAVKEIISWLKSK